MKMTLVYRALQAFAVSVFLILAATTNAMAAGYFAQGGKIHDAYGQEIQIRGVTHFGFNTLILQPQYLWSMGWKEQIAQMKSLGFNTIRVPFVPDTLYITTPVNQLSYIDPKLNPELIGKTPLQVLDLWMVEANRQGMYILLDFHSVSKQRLYPTWFVSNPADFNLTYNNQAYTKENWTRDLAFVAQRYANLPYFFGIDIYNEPNGQVRWSTGDANVTDPAYFWKAAAELASAAVLAANPNLMIFVQGISGNFDGIENSSVPMNWGEDFQPQAYQPLNIPNAKLVLSPHTYGPDVYMKSSFSATTFPANLAASWDALFGQFYQTHPVVIGEWGGKYGQGTGGQQDITWQNTFVDYLLSKGIRNSFYWCYTPNSGDTGGILDDSLNVRQDKMALLKKLWGTATPSVPQPVPVTPPTSVGSQAIFNDATASLWALSGWSSTSTVQSQFVKSGTSAVKVDATTWGGVSFDSRNANWIWTDQPANLYTHLSFDVSAGSVVGAAMTSLVASLDLGWGLSAKISDYVTSYAPNAWYHVEIPLSVMNPNGAAFRKIVFQNNSTSNLTFYIDKVELVKRTGSPTPTPTPITTTTAIFNDAMASLWALSGWSSTSTVQSQFVKSGTGAVKVDATTWGGVSFDSRNANWIWTDQPANLYTHVSFDVSAGSVVGAAMSSLVASLDLGWGLSAKISNYVPAFAPGVWYHVEIPLSVMNPKGVPFRKIVLQNNTASNLTFYIDKVELIKRATSSVVPTVAAPSPTPTPATTGGTRLQSCINIMPLGDSITLGVNGGYRNNLYTGLQQNNCGVSYVGTQSDQWTRVADKDHEGHPGFTVGNIASNVNAWTASTQPNIILLMAGTNDIAWWTAENADQIGARHNALIDQLRTARPNAWIFVASIPPEASAIIQPNNIDRAVLTQQFNALIRKNVEARTAAGQRVRFVDVNAALTTADLYDGIHPTEAGHAKIAQKFLEGIRAALAAP